MSEKYYAPTFNEKAFNCPYCNVYANQIWSFIHSSMTPQGISTARPEMRMSTCFYCGQPCYWYKGQMIVPDAATAPYPNSDMPEAVKEDYLEARSIVGRSPRGAAALLRLCLQNLLIHLGEIGKSIDQDIKSLVTKGLPIEVQQALDIVRVIGNNAVHPGAMDLKDDQYTAVQLFELINFIVEDRITRKKAVAALFDRLPGGAREAIARRDGQS